MNINLKYLNTLSIEELYYKLIHVNNNIRNLSDNIKGPFYGDMRKYLYEQSYHKWCIIYAIMCVMLSKEHNWKYIYDHRIGNQGCPECGMCVALLVNCKICPLKQCTKDNHAFKRFWISYNRAISSLRDHHHETVYEITNFRLAKNAAYDMVKLCKKALEKYNE